jgi:uncharacterized protein (DUF1501 family)
MPMQPLRRQTLALASALISPIGVVRAQARTEDAPSLVVIFLRGAVDGLNVLVPYAENAYYQARPTIAIAPPGQPNGAIALTNQFGLHPALGNLKSWWDQGHLGFVLASGSPDPTRSHFDAQDYMETATPGRKSTPSGWLNRLAFELAGGPALKALNVGTNLPRALSGPHQVAVLAAGASATRTSALDNGPLQQSLMKLYQGHPELAQLAQLSAQSRSEIMQALAADNQESMADPTAQIGAVSVTGFAQDAARLGQLMRRDPGIRLAFVALGGWDTHVNQGGAQGQMAVRLAALSQGIGSLAEQLGSRFKHTTIIVMSEFGRTLAQNGSQGTDHGHGNVMWLLGASVHGAKLHGRWPGLERPDLHEQRDLAITTDFRTVLIDYCSKQLRLSDTALQNVFPSLPARTEVPGLWRLRA